MSTFHDLSAAWIALVLLFGSLSPAMSQTYPQRDNQRMMDQLRSQRLQSERRMQDGLLRQQQRQDATRQQLELQDQIRRQQLRNEMERQQIQRK